MRRLPGVTVAISSYNYAAYLPATIQSVLAQEGVDLDLRLLHHMPPVRQQAIGLRAGVGEELHRLLAHLASLFLRLALAPNGLVDDGLAEQADAGLGLLDATL